MTRRILPLFGLAALTILGTQQSAAAAGKPPVAGPKVTVTTVSLAASGCGVENFCVDVQWNVQNVPANPQVMSFEVSSTLTTSNGSCPAATKSISDHTARAAKLGFFQSGTCTGAAKTANVTVKLFTRDVEGQKVLSSTATKSQTF